MIHRPTCFAAGNNCARISLLLKTNFQRSKTNIAKLNLYRVGQVVADIGFLTFILGIPLGALFCIGCLKLGRKGRGAGQDWLNIEIKFSQPRSTTTCPTLYKGAALHSLYFAGCR